MPHTHTHNHLSKTENVELLATGVGAVVALDQLAKTLESKDNKVSHLSKAAIGATVAIGAWELLQREEREKAKGGTGNYMTGGNGEGPHHHNRHLVEEIVGAYGLGKELMGDRKHHFTHLVEEAIGALGLLQEVNTHGPRDVKEIKGLLAD
ncbi:hypothetical protein ACEPPN_019123 [Leptodophora sp. 'Broadleaf-Isolate-01']